MILLRTYSILGLLFTTFATSPYLAKALKQKKGKKSSKVGKSSKLSKKTTNGPPKACKLPKMKSKYAGKPYWIQTGQVMTPFGDSTIPRKTFTDEEPMIANNDQYMVQCSDAGYVPDEMCFYTCTDGVLDSSTYCQSNPKDICVKTRETTISKQCPLDFDSDEAFHNGKSLKMWWGEVLEKYNVQKEQIFSRESDIPFYLGHGGALLEGYGLAAQHFVIPAAVKEFNADAIELTGWISGVNYNYGPDMLRNSDTSPADGYVQGLETEDVTMGPFVLPNVIGPIKDFDPVLKITSLIRDYDPCDDSNYLGFSPECFIYHPAGYHLGNGKMIMYRSPLSNGNIDLQGVCTGAETAPPVLIDALVTNMNAIAPDVEKGGGFTGLHPASWTLHLCVDDDINHPYLCSEHKNLPIVSDGDYVPVDAAPFMAIPTKMRKKLCADRTTAGPQLCSPTDDTTYPFPWTQYL